VGNIWLAHGYSNDMFQARADAEKAGRPFRIGYAIPREGAVLALDSMVLHRTGRHPELAQSLHRLHAGRGKLGGTDQPDRLGQPQPGRHAYIRPEIAIIAPFFPMRPALKRLEMMRDLDRKSRRVLNRIWTEIKLR
jgi:spermidine/putrescine transport system substrate-binding protein